MKKLLLILFALFSLLIGSFMISAVNRIDQMHSYSFLYTDGGVFRFNIFDENEINNLDQILKRVASQQNKNLFISDNEKVFNPKAPIQETFQVIEGNTEEMNQLCSEWKSNQQCAIDMIAPENKVSIIPFHHDVEPYVFYVSGNEQTLSDFQSQLKKQLPDSKISAGAMIGNPSPILLNALFSSLDQTYVFLFTILMMAVILLYFISQSKSFAIKKLHGYSLIRVYWDEMKKILCDFAIISVLSICCVLLYLIIQGIHLQYIWIYAGIHLLLILMFVVFYTVLTFPFLYWSCHQKIVSSLKGKQNLNAGKVVFPIIKICLIAVCIAQCCGYLFSIKKAVYNINNQEIYAQLSKNYSIFYPNEEWNRANPDDTYIDSVIALFQKTSDVTYFKKEIQLRGNLVIDLYSRYGYTVNTEYINRLHLKDIDGNVVSIPKDAGKFLLMSEKYREEQEAIKHGSPVMENHIIYLKENQPLFLFDVDEKKRENGISDEYIFFTDTQQQFRQLDTREFYVEASIEDMRETLKEAGFKDHLSYERLVDLSNHESIQWKERAGTEIFRSFCFLCMLMIIICFDTTFYKASHWKEITVKQLMGYHEIRVHSHRIVLEFGCLLLEFALAYVMMFTLGHNGFYIDNFWIVSIATLLFSFAVFFLSIYLMNRKSLQENLKNRE